MSVGEAYERTMAYDSQRGYGQYAGYFAPQVAPIPGNESRIILLTGFPQDIKERELNNLLLFLPGYEVSVNKATRTDLGHLLSAYIAQNF